MLQIAYQVSNRNVKLSKGAFPIKPSFSEFLNFFA